MWKKKKQIKVVGPENYYCLYCALDDNLLVEAEYTIWDIDKCIPVCEYHLEEMAHPKFVSAFSLN